MVTTDKSELFDDLLENTKKIFESLIEDPDYQDTDSKSREEVVLQEALQRAKQHERNKMALSMLEKSPQLQNFTEFTLKKAKPTRGESAIQHPTSTGLASNPWRAIADILKTYQGSGAGKSSPISSILGYLEDIEAFTPIIGQMVSNFITRKQAEEIQNERYPKNPDEAAKTAGYVFDPDSKVGKEQYSAVQYRHNIRNTALRHFNAQRKEINELRRSPRDAPFMYYGQEFPHDTGMGRFGLAERAYETTPKGADGTKALTKELRDQIVSLYVNNNPQVSQRNQYLFNLPFFPNDELMHIAISEYGSSTLLEPHPYGLDGQPLNLDPASGVMGTPSPEQMAELGYREYTHGQDAFADAVQSNPNSVGPPVPMNQYKEYLETQTTELKKSIMMLSDLVNASSMIESTSDADWPTHLPDFRKKFGSSVQITGTRKTDQVNIQVAVNQFLAEVQQMCWNMIDEGLPAMYVNERGLLVPFNFHDRMQDKQLFREEPDVDNTEIIHSVGLYWEKDDPEVKNGSQEEGMPKTVNNLITKYQPVDFETVVRMKQENLTQRNQTQFYEEVIELLKDHYGTANVTHDPIYDMLMAPILMAFEKERNNPRALKPVYDYFKWRVKEGSNTALLFSEETLNDLVALQVSNPEAYEQVMRVFHGQQGHRGEYRRPDRERVQKALADRLGLYRANVELADRRRQDRHSIHSAMRDMTKSLAEFKDDYNEEKERLLVMN